MFDFLDFSNNLLLPITAGYYGFWRFVSIAIGMMTMSPVDWVGGEGYNAVVGFEEGFKVVGCMLASIFWLIGFIGENLDPKGEMRLETIVKMLIKISITDTLVCTSFSLVTGLFGLVNYLCDALDLKEKDLLPFASDKFTAAVGELGIGDSIIALMFAYLFTICMWIAGGIILYTAFIRFFRILIGIPYAAIANSTIAGSREIYSTAVGYWKTMFVNIFSGVTMIIALRIMSAVVSSGVIGICESSDKGLVYVLLYLVQAIFIVLCTAGAIKGSEELTRRFLGA